MPRPLSPDEHDVRDLVRAVVRAEVMPGAAERDETSSYPESLIRRFAELDLMGLTVPVAYGGAGLETPSLLVAVEEIAYGDAALASIYTAHCLAIETLLLYGTESQRDRYLRPLATGTHLGAFALTEPDAGSDIGALRTTAAKTADGWTLSGTKTFISNAREAGALIVFARTGDIAGLRGVSAFVVAQDADHIKFSTPQDKAGIRSAPTYEVYFDDLRVDEAALIGDPGQGGRIALAVLNRARIDIAAMANGIAMRALQLTTEFASSRIQFGRPIREFQAIQLGLGRMDVAIEQGRLAALWAADLKDAGADVRRAGAIAKYVATEGCFQVVDTAVQIHGGTGYMREVEIERLYRDCRVLRIYEGTSEIQLLTIAGALATSFQESGSLF